MTSFCLLKRPRCSHVKIYRTVRECVKCYTWFLLKWNQFFSWSEIRDMSIFFPNIIIDVQATVWHYIQPY